MRPEAEPLYLSPSEEQQLRQMARGRRTESRLVQRATIILAVAGGDSIKAIAAKHHTTRTTVRYWRNCYCERRQAEPQGPVCSRLQDKERSGARATITAEQYVDLLALASTEPESLGLPFTHWSDRDLAAHAPFSIHHTTVSRFLKECNLKPHRVVGWMNRKADPDFDRRATHVKQVLAHAVSPQADPKEVVLSFDEKPGIQALERIAKDKPMQVGRPVKQEFEYRRHGTLVLLAMMLISTGEILSLVSPTRTNEDTADLLRMHLVLLLFRGFRRITIVLDQLNTHMSLDVVEMVASVCGVPLPDPTTLKTMAQRRAWLESTDKSIVFCFTPKHASWLNPIEIWFGVLARKALRRGSFASLDELRAKLNAFIQYYNEKMAHPYKLRQLKKRSPEPPVQWFGTSAAHQ
jgi:transposase